MLVVNFDFGHDRVRRLRKRVLVLTETDNPDPDVPASPFPVHSTMAARSPCNVASTRMIRAPIMASIPYTAQGSTVFRPAASNGAVSRVATIIAFAAAVAAM